MEWFLKILPFLQKIVAHFQQWEKDTRPFSKEKAKFLAERWQALPDHVKTPFQMIGKNSTGCEGTQGVFPRCNFSCQPCYHSKNANAVPIHRQHTLKEIEKQLTFFNKNEA